MATIKIKKEGGMVPAYAHPGDSGMDLFSADDCVIKPGERKLISAGIRLEIPDGYEAQTRPKSGLAINHGITVLNTPGTIDSSYRGEIKVILINLGNEDYAVNKGSKIAQLVINKVERAEILESETLGQTTRNEGGFGSTGI
ncbi:dUTP diphosphatase [Candidatus Woesearchaeota archaeon]|nr:dUTP diphosphatase [Candidatus Woesearchaeota archaeon]